jgi:hypothetical protein
MPYSRARRGPFLALPEWLFLGLVVLGCAAFAVWLGKSTSWDFRNYHWYAPYAFLNGRMGFDIAVSHQASYFNPLLDVPFYWLATHTASWVALGVMGAVQGANIVPLYLIAREILAAREGRLAPAALALFCLTGGLTVSLFGTTYYDNVLSVFVLSGLAIVIVGRETLVRGTLVRAALVAGVAGFVIGSAVGLKLPQAPYALGLAAALAWPPGDAKRRSVRVAAGTLGGVAGLVLFAGYWFWRMDAITGNPLFPYFNDVFHSPLVAAASFRDTRFLPHDLWHALLDPILFSIDWRVADDLPFTDIRVGIAYVLMIAAGLTWLARRLRKDAPAGATLTEPGATAMLFAFAVISYVAWILVFGIYRYILALEMLAPLAIIAAIAMLPITRKARLVTLGCLAAAIALTSRPNFLKRAPLGDPYVQVKLPKIPDPDNTMILMTGAEPMGYLVPELPHQIPVLRIDGWLIQPQDGSKLTDEAKARVKAFKGDLFLIANPYEVNRARAALGAYGLAFRLDQCRDISSNLGGPYLFCALTRKAD